MSLFRETDGVIPPNWFQCSADRVLRDDGCEVNFGREIGKKNYWTAMVPAMQEQHVWCGSADEAGVIKFLSAQKANSHE